MYNQNNNNYGKNNNYGCRNHRKNNKNIKNTRKDNNVFADKNTEIKRFYVGSNLSDGIIEDSTINKDISGNMADSISLGRSVKYQDHRNNLNKALRIIEERDLLKDGGIVVCEYEKGHIETGLKLIKEKSYGPKNIKIYGK